MPAAAAYREAGGEPARCGSSPPSSRLPYERPPLTKEFLRGESSPGRPPARPSPTGTGSAGSRSSCDVEVAELDLDAGEARGADGRTWRFDRCLLATGARPLVPEIPGRRRPRRPHGADDRRLRAAAGAGRLPGGLVVGSGFIGCEAAASLARLGAEVTMATLEGGPQVERLGEEAAARIGPGWLEGSVSSSSPKPSWRRSRSRPSGSLARFEDGRERRRRRRRPGARDRPQRRARGAAPGFEVDDGVLGRRRDGLVRTRGCSPPATSPPPRTRPPGAGCGSNTGARR